MSWVRIPFKPVLSFQAISILQSCVFNCDLCSHIVMNRLPARAIKIAKRAEHGGIVIFPDLSRQASLAIFFASQPNRKPAFSNKEQVLHLNLNFLCDVSLFVYLFTGSGLRGWKFTEPCFLCSETTSQRYGTMSCLKVLHLSRSASALLYLDDKLSTCHTQK